MPKTPKQIADPQDQADAGPGLTASQSANLGKVIRGIGKQPMSSGYRGASSYSLLAGEA